MNPCSNVAMALTNLSDRADAVLALVAKLRQARDPYLADEVAEHATGLRHAADRVLRALLAETTR